MWWQLYTVHALGSVLTLSVYVSITVSTANKLILHERVTENMSSTVSLKPIVQLKKALSVVSGEHLTMRS